MKTKARHPQKANVALGDALRRLRTKAGMSQERLAALAGVHRNHVGDIERGEKEACLLIMVRLCQALHIPFSALALEMEHPGREDRNESLRGSR